jgi:hypothetical protein
MEDKDMPAWYLPYLAQAGLAGGQYLLDRRAQNKAFEQNKQFWHERFDKEAQYNSPVQQKARMQAAGLSPALMYKGGQTGGNVSGGSAQGKIAEKAQLTELARMSAEVAKIKAQTQKEQVTSDYIASRTTGQQTTNKVLVQDLLLKELDVKYGDETRQASIKKILQDAINKSASTMSINQEIDIIAKTRQKLADELGIDAKGDKITMLLQLLLTGADKGSDMINTMMLER